MNATLRQLEGCIRDYVKCMATELQSVSPHEETNHVFKTWSAVSILQVSPPHKVQFAGNQATVGGSIYGRFGFSDVLTGIIGFGYICGVI